MEDRLIILLGFLLIFHIFGAATLGSAVRGLWKAAQGEAEAVFGHLFFLIFGGLFACFPLAFGLQAGQPEWILGLQISVVSLTFTIAVLFGRATWRGLRALLNINTGLIILGGGFISAGFFGGAMMIREGLGFLLSLLFGSVFVAIGLGIIILGLSNLFKNLSS